MKLDQAQVDAQALNIAYCHIVSPVTGRVGLRLVDPGNYVQTTSTSGIAVITQLQPITVIFTIPEDDLPEIMPQLNAGTTLPVTAYDRANLHQLATGQGIGRRQSDRHHDRDRESARAIRQCRQCAVPEPVRQCAASDQDAAKRRSRCRHRRSSAARRAPMFMSSMPTARSRCGRSATSAIDGSLTAVTSGLAAGERVVVDGTDRLRDGCTSPSPPIDGQPAAPGAATRPDKAAGQGQNGGRSQNPPPRAGSSTPGDANAGSIRRGDKAVR